LTVRRLRSLARSSEACWVESEARSATAAAADAASTTATTRRMVFAPSSCFLSPMVVPPATRREAQNTVGPRTLRFCFLEDMSTAPRTSRRGSEQEPPPHHGHAARHGDSPNAHCWHVLLHAPVSLCCSSLTNPARTASLPARDRHDANVGPPNVSTRQPSTQRNPHTPALKSKDASPPEGTGTVRVLCGLFYRSPARSDATLGFSLGICQGHLLGGLGCMPTRGQRAI